MILAVVVVIDSLMPYAFNHNLQAGFLFRSGQQSQVGEHGVLEFDEVFPRRTRPSVNCAKDWLDHSFLFPGLIWSEKEFHFGCDN